MKYKTKEELIKELHELHQEHDKLSKSYQILRSEVRLDEDMMIKLLTAVNTTSDAIFLTDTEGIITYVNSGFTALYGYTADEVVGKVTPRIIKSGLLDKEVYKGFWKTLKNKTEVKGELLNKRKNGEDVIIEGTASPVFDEQNMIIGFLGIQRDITERKQVELEHKESEIKFKEIINQINDGIVVFDEQGKIIIWNRGAEQIFGIKTEDAIDKNIADIQYQFAPPALKDKALIENVINGIVTLQTPEVFNRIIDNEIVELNSENLRNIQSIIFPIKLVDYNLFCSVFRDTTEIKQFEKQLLKLNAEKDKFFSIIAHDLRSPFNSFLGYTKLMAEELDTFSIKEIQEFVVTMSKSATNLYNLLDNLLHWARMNQGLIPFKPQKMSFTDICKDVLEILSPNAVAKNITINHFAADQINILADIDMLQMVLRNLISNAIKFTNNGGTINISAKQAPSNITISVSDNGIGIKHDVLIKLFDISQLQTTIGTAEEKGTGLGLILCKEFVEKHGGTIWAESKPGKGSKFKFTLPIDTEKAIELNN
jgi:PAS domain S-box-containing protein